MHTFQFWLNLHFIRNSKVNKINFSILKSMIERFSIEKVVHRFYAIYVCLSYYTPSE